MHANSLWRGELFQAAIASEVEESSKYHFLTECNAIALLPGVGSGGLRGGFLGRPSFFHCAGPTWICVEGQGSTQTSGVADMAESSRQVTPDAYHRPEGSWRCLLQGVVSLPRWTWGGGRHRVLSPRAPSLRQGWVPAGRDSSAHLSPRPLTENIKSQETHKLHLHSVSNYIYGFVPDQGSICYCNPLLSSPVEQCTHYQVSFGLGFLYSNAVIQVAKRMQTGCSWISWNILGILLKRDFMRDSGLNKSLPPFFFLMAGLRRAFVILLVVILQEWNICVVIIKVIWHGKKKHLMKWWAQNTLWDLQGCIVWLCTHDSLCYACLLSLHIIESSLKASCFYKKNFVFLISMTSTFSRSLLCQID